MDNKEEVYMNDEELVDDVSEELDDTGSDEYGILPKPAVIKFPKVPYRVLQVDFIAFLVTVGLSLLFNALGLPHSITNFTAGASMLTMPVLVYTMLTYDGKINRAGCHITFQDDVLSCIQIVGKFKLRNEGCKIRFTDIASMELERYPHVSVNDINCLTITLKEPADDSIITISDVNEPNKFRIMLTGYDYEKAIAFIKTLQSEIMEYNPDVQIDNKGC